MPQVEGARGQTRRGFSASLGDVRVANFPVILGIYSPKEAGRQQTSDVASAWSDLL